MARKKGEIQVLFLDQNVMWQTLR